MKFRKIILKSGTEILLGKNEKNNDDLMKEFEGKENTIIHTLSPGSPFCVIESNLNPSTKDIRTSGAICAGYSQDWRDNKKDVTLNVFTGKDIFKKKYMKPGTWEVKKPKKIKVKKQDIISFEKER